MPSIMMQRDKMDLRIRILGAGMGGLTCALALAKGGFRDIQVYESASSLGFVGAGIQLAPNMARILDRLGVWHAIEKEAVPIYETSILQGSTEQEHGHVDLRGIESLYGYQHRVGHRSNLAGSIYEGCKLEKNIKFFFSTRAESIKFHPFPSFRAVERNGPSREVEADVLLCADGIKSAGRGDMLRELGATDQIIDTNQAAYRIMLTKEQMKGDAELLELINGNKVTRWIGEKRHIIAYPIASNTIYNLSTVQPDVNFAAAPSETYTTKGSKEAMLKVFSDFCPKVQRMLNLVPEGEVCEWKLRVHEPLGTWVLGSTALLGDACHPTLPHLNQGAAQAIEDAEVISIVLSSMADATPESINKALHVYERVRKTRAETLVALAAASGRAMHLGEGAAKAERDRQFLAAKNGKGPLPDKWADADVQKMIFGFDCQKATREVLGEYSYIAV